VLLDEERKREQELQPILLLCIAAASVCSFLAFFLALRRIYCMKRVGVKSGGVKGSRIPSSREEFPFPTTFDFMPVLMSLESSFFVLSIGL